MKTDCFKFQIDKVLASIDEFHCVTLKRPSYLVMSQATRDGIIKETISSVETKCNSPIATLYGIPVVISESLNYGEIDIV